jgi:phosphoglycerate dehydrogenase-like enzyme
LLPNPFDILITLPFEHDLINRLSGISPRLRFISSKARKPEDIPPDLWAKAEVLYTNTILPAPELAPQLRWVQLHWAGVDHAIQHPLLQRPGLVATNLSGASASQMGEFVVMMPLALGHHLPLWLPAARQWPSSPGSSSACGAARQHGGHCWLRGIKPGGAPFAKRRDQARCIHPADTDISLRPGRQQR